MKTKPSLAFANCAMKKQFLAICMAGFLVLIPQAAAADFFFATLTGPGENPPNASTATGTALVEMDLGLNFLRVQVQFNGLTGGNAIAAHIHARVAPPANIGVAVGTVGFPAATSGVYDMTFDTTLTGTYSAPFVAANGGTAAGAEQALFNALIAGEAYFNIHNVTFPGGEIRGFFNAVPEPSSWYILAIGVAGVALLRCRSRRAVIVAKC